MGIGPDPGKAVSVLLTLSLLAAAAIGASSVPAVAATPDLTKSATSINIFWESSQSVRSMTWIHRSIKVEKSAKFTYFSMIGNWTPPFYLGIQQAEPLAANSNRKLAIFSAWDVSKNNDCTTCDGKTKPAWGAVEVRRSGVGVEASRFGYEGTGAKAILENFDWKVGEEIEAVVHLEVVSGGSEISGAIRTGGGGWKFLATYFYPQVFTTLEPGYSFIEDWVGSPLLERSATYFDSWMENDSADTQIWLNQATVMPNETNKNVDFHLVKALPEGIYLKSGGTLNFSKTRSYSVKSNNSNGERITNDAKQALLNPLTAVSPLALSAKQKTQLNTQFKNCAALRKFFPYGVAASAQASLTVTKGRIAPPVSQTIYLKNKKLDADLDKVACE